MSRETAESCVLCCATDAAYDERIGDLRVVGAGFRTHRFDYSTLIRIAESVRPTHMVLRFPSPQFLRWALDRRLRVLPLLADSFHGGSLRARFQNRSLARALGDARIPWIANHSVNASRSLASLGIAETKIVPYDYVPTVTPDGSSPKTLRTGAPSRTLLFVGALIPSKGAWDCVSALARLPPGLGRVDLRIVGTGDDRGLLRHAGRRRVAHRIQLLGRVEHSRVLDLMRECDAILVPSRHDYPEGLPMTIYEAFCSRTPIIASDHPMFADRVQHHRTGLVFRAGDSAHLARSVATLFRDAELYAALSAASYDAWQRLQLPVKWEDLIRRWLRDGEDDRAYLSRWSLAHGGYA
jgi:glycosyltransferase involved in cell wall biosynthesis